MLSKVLESLKEVQQAGGMDWWFVPTPTNGLVGATNNPVDVTLKFPIYFILGDTEGHNKAQPLPNLMSYRKKMMMKFRMQCMCEGKQW